MTIPAGCSVWKTRNDRAGAMAARGQSTDVAAAANLACTGVGVTKLTIRGRVVQKHCARSATFTFSVVLSGPRSVSVLKNCLASRCSNPRNPPSSAAPQTLSPRQTEP